jgi:hypothetical protein
MAVLLAWTSSLAAQSTLTSLTLNQATVVGGAVPTGFARAYR